MRCNLISSLVISSVGLAGLLAVAGCSDSLATGYTPRPLGVSSTERRGYYASPFTPEAAAAQQSKSDITADPNSFRRPGAYR